MTISSTQYIEFDQGGLFTFIISRPDLGNMTGWAARLQFKDRVAGTIYLSLTTGGGIVNNGDGTFTVKVLPTQSLIMAITDGVWDMYADPDGSLDNATVALQWGVWHMRLAVTDVGAVPSPMTPPLQVSDWYVDWVNGSDSNPGTMSSPVKSVMGGIVARWGTNSPALLQDTTIHVLTPQPINVENIVIEPTLFGKIMFWIQGAPQQIASFALGAVTPKHVSSNTQLQAGGFSSSGIQVGHIVHNTTSGKDSWAFVRALAGGVATLGQPISALTPGVNSPYDQPSPIDTWATGDTVIVYAPCAINLRQLTVKGGGASTPDYVKGSVWLTGLDILDASGADGSSSIVFPETGTGVLNMQLCTIRPYLYGNTCYVMNCRNFGGEIHGDSSVSSGYSDPSATYIGFYDLINVTNGFSSGCFLDIYGYMETGDIRIENACRVFHVVFLNDVCWGPGSLDVYEGGSFFKESLSRTWSNSLYLTPLSVVSKTVASAYDQNTGAWLSNIPITAANLDAYGSLTNPANGARFSAYPASPVIVPGHTSRLHLVGDSNTAGSNGDGSGHVGGYRYALESSLRALRGDFDFIGSVVDTPESSAPGLWFHDGHSGYRIEQITSAYAGYVSSPGVGVPDVVIDMLGTNNIANGDLLSTLQSKRASLDAAIDAVAPSSRRIILGVLPFVQGSTTGGSQSTWDALRVSYNNWLATYVAGMGSRYTLLDIAGNFGQGNFQSDGVHLNLQGQAALGYELARILDTSILGRRGEQPGSRLFRERQPWHSLLCGGAGNGASVSGNSGFTPGSSSFVFAVDIYPTSLDAAALHTIAEYGTYAGGTPVPFWGLYQQGQAVRLYFAKGGGTIFGMTDEVALRVNEWHRIVFIADAATLTAGLYVNAKCVGVAQGLGAWNITAGTFYLGDYSSFTGCPGYYSRVHAYVAASVPRPGSMAAILSVEGDYYLGKSIVGSGMTAGYELNNNLTVGYYGQPDLVLAGSAAFVAPYPGGTPIRPWEFPT